MPIDKRTIISLIIFAALPECGEGPNACRIYLTNFSRTTTTTDLPQGPVMTTNSWNCTFDRSTITTTCTTTAGPASTSTTTWASIDDAVASEHPIGKFTHRTSRTTSDACVITNTLSYDLSGRATSSLATASATTCKGTSLVYGPWDPLGRPILATVFGVGAETCMGGNMTLSYDDALRTVTTTHSGGVGCVSWTTTARYNADGIVIASTLSQGSISATSDLSIVSTAQICKH